MSQAPSVIVGRHLTPPCFCSFSIMSIKARAKRFLHGHLNLLDMNYYLRSCHLRWYHCWLYLSLSNNQKPQKSEGKIIGFFLPSSTLKPKQLQLKFALSCTQLLLDLRGEKEELFWAGGEKSHRPHWGQTLGGCLRAETTRPGRAE